MINSTDTSLENYKKEQGRVENGRKGNQAKLGYRRVFEFNE